MQKLHHYQIKLSWTGNLGNGTKSYSSYSRNHLIEAKGKPLIEGSSDPTFRGDPDKYNPEELFVSSIASCHMLWMLHLCTSNKITVTSYVDNPQGVMIEEKSGSGRFERVTLNPIITIKEKDKMEQVNQLHKEAHNYCFIANSLNFPVECHPQTLVDKK